MLENLSLDVLCSIFQLQAVLRHMLVACAFWSLISALLWVDGNESMKRLLSMVNPGMIAGKGPLSSSLCSLCLLHSSPRNGPPSSSNTQVPLWALLWWSN